jgi:hypothetical protein
MYNVEYTITEVIYKDKYGNKYIEYHARVMGGKGYWKVQYFTSKCEAELWCKANQQYAGLIPK